MTTENIQEITQDDFTREVLESPVPVAVDFYSTECAPCEAVAPKFEALARLFGPHVKFVKIFRQGNRQLAETLAVRSSPTLLFFKGGQEVSDRLTGAVRRSAISDALRSMIDPAIGDAIAKNERPKTTHTDLLILGGGPAGLTAGIYAAQAKLDVIVVDAGLGGGNLAITHQISNFPGFPKPQPGYMLAHLMVEHAKAAGVTMRLAADVTDVRLAERSLVVDGIETIVAKKILIATGSSPRLIGVKGEREYKGKGISYCATCDAKYYEGKHVVVIGGGNSAVEEAVFIAKFASKITVVHQFAELQANRAAQEQAFANPKIDFVFEHEPREFIHDGSTVGTVVVENLKTHALERLACDGVFIFAGMRPNLDLFPERFELDRFGYLKVDDEMRTSVKDVFAAGDIVSKRYRQMTTAISDGTVASIVAARELSA
jgi:thioredoxin reductase (NADPH)